MSLYRKGDIAAFGSGSDRHRVSGRIMDNILDSVSTAAEFQGAGYKAHTGGRAGQGIGADASRFSIIFE